MQYFTGLATSIWTFKIWALTREDTHLIGESSTLLQGNSSPFTLSANGRARVSLIYWRPKDARGGHRRICAFRG